MPRVDVTIFNASADEPDVVDAIISLTGAKMTGGASAVTASQQSNSIAIDLFGAEMSGDVGNVAVTAGGEQSAYINQRNQWGATFISGMNVTVLEPTDDRYIYGRCANFLEMQILNFCDGQRNAISSQMEQLLLENPLTFMTLHDTPFHGWRAYEELNNRVSAWKYKYAVRHSRFDTVVYTDYDERARGIPGPRTPGTGASAVSMMPQVTDTGLQDWYGDFLSDLLMGTAYATDPNASSDDGPDLSFRCGPFNDSTQIVSPNINAKCQAVINWGSIVSVTISNTRLASCVVNPDGSQTISQNRVGDDFFSMRPSGVGFVGNVISQVSDNGNGTYTIVMEDFPFGADSNQEIVPQSGWDFCINNYDSATQALDWDEDGTTEGVVAGHWLWGAGWHAIYDRIETRVLQQHGRESGRGANMLNRSFGIWKEGDGWPYPHVFTEAVDYPSAENMMSAQGVLQNDDVYGSYTFTNSFSMALVMRSVGFSTNYIKEPNGFMVDKCSGAQMEVNLSGESDQDYANLSLIDFRFGEWWWAMYLNWMPKVVLRLHIPENRWPVGLPHFFLDLDTNFTGALPFGTYDEGGGSVGPDGPRGSWTWSTGEVGDLTDNGRRIYIRRYGDFLVLVNMADKPGDYGSQYTLSYAARNPEDIITPSDWSDLYSGGMLNGGETLSYPDYDNYINQRLTAYLQAQNPSYWGGFNYGPKQPHPADAVASGSLATAEWMLDDPLYDGSSVSTSSNFALPFFQARVLQIS